MADTLEVECGFCRKRFRLKPEQVNHDVRCPHCRTAVKIPARTDMAVEAAEALRRPAPPRSAAGHRSGAGQRAGPGQRPLPSRGSHSQTVVVVSAVLLVVALVGGGIGLWAVYGRSQAPSSSSEMGREAGRGGSGPKPAAAAPGAPAVGAVSPATGAPTTPGVLPVPTAPGAPPPPAAVEPIAIKVERLLGGFRDDTITYAVGRVTNHTDSPILVLKVIVPITDSSGNAVGEALAMILNLPPKTTVPLVAEWVHAEGARGIRGDVHFVVNPAGVPRDLPAMNVEDVLPWPDPNTLILSGVVKARVTNMGFVPVGTIDAVAILVGADGKIVGCAKNSLTKDIKPRKSQDITIRWDHCSKSLVNTAEVWVQPAL